MIERDNDYPSPEDYYGLISNEEKKELGKILVENCDIEPSDVIENMSVDDIIWELSNSEKQEMYDTLHDRYGEDSDDREYGKYELIVDGDYNVTMYDEILAKQLMIIHQQRFKLSSEEEEFIEKLSKRL